MSFTIGKVKM